MEQFWKMESMDCYKTWPFLCCQLCWKPLSFGVRCNVYAAFTSWDITSFKIQNEFLNWQVTFDSAGVLNKRIGVALYVLYRLYLTYGWIISSLHNRKCDLGDWKFIDQFIRKVVWLGFVVYLFMSLKYLKKYEVTWAMAVCVCVGRKG